ncbi:TIGR03084 family metal-binding protein [Alisedimentitalea sp. MJ-SS2]|uniref:TIGR03084 family metal-binding protein n=1 Tax=Aliisedimentitalea sp. MJ-SS2 TaxID=3049795 RepID=UPI00290CAAA1|nr:TIGR03084 family metal-binding protein [Alisedimentitalea sp. MJ-SS2]MDU8929233.1 TIGR03084 family metal-binding protein [Alisedimentitalea sp. MJ-SS2]
MSFEQVQDFLEESEALYAVLCDLNDEALTQETQFKGWTIEDVIRHLHFWNRAVDFAAQGEEAFSGLRNRVMGAINKGQSLRVVERKVIPESGRVLRATWIGFARAVAKRWEGQNPKARLPWVGPEMSARSAMTARQMETWAHGFEVFDLLGKTRQEHDRIRNIVVLGVNTFGWSHKVQGLSVPEDMPAIRLEAPSGEIWEYGGSAGKIEGKAADFAAVVTQTRALADTGLKVEGDVARLWMENAQCFAGPKETPPAPGSRGVG